MLSCCDLFLFFFRNIQHRNAELSEKELLRRLVLRVLTVTKSFEGYGTFHGIVDRLRTVKNGNRVELAARIVYEDGDDEDIFFDELLQIVDLETLSSGVVQLNSPIHQIHTDSCSFLKY